jgi:fatty acid desaturase
MTNQPEARKGSAMRTVDTVLVVAAVIGAVLIGMWAFGAIVGLVLWVFKIAILAIVVFALVRFLTRRR